ncbi:hypothetical protein DFH08DRAFT_796930 [Mycena albidolilacea]|uniref:Uncharacterized protein n=1 Tax=Mycena albidolilacea TaxID=1033008 RepID=A0AAD7AW43_9AGAR|nr:hypothetical protein DFH08DRAFT_796930 [Mycena albidolilacea]
MFKLLTILPFLAAIVANSVAAPHRGGVGTKAAAGNAAAAGVAVGTQTTTADASQSTPCSSDGAAGDAVLPLCKDVANGFAKFTFLYMQCTTEAFFNSCFGTPPCPGVTFSPADTAGISAERSPKKALAMRRRRNRYADGRLAMPGPDRWGRGPPKNLLTLGTWSSAALPLRQFSGTQVQRQSAAVSGSLRHLRDFVSSLKNLYFRHYWRIRLNIRHFRCFGRKFVACIAGLLKNSNKDRQKVNKMVGVKFSWSKVCGRSGNRGGSGCRSGLIVTFRVVTVAFVVGGMVITPPPPVQTYSRSLKGIWLQDRLASGFNENDQEPYTEHWADLCNN